MGSQDDIADQRKAHPRARGNAIDGNYQRDPQVMPGGHHRVEMVAQATADVRAGTLLRFLDQVVAHEVRTRTEATAGARQEHRAHRGIAVDGRRGRAQILDHLQIEGIELVGAIEGHVGDLVAPLEQYGFEHNRQFSGIAASRRPLWLEAYARSRSGYSTRAAAWRLSV